MNRYVLPTLLLALPAGVFAQAGAQPDYRLPDLSEQTDNRLSTSPELFVREIRVDGVTAFTPGEILGLVAPYTNRMVTSADLQTLRTDLTKLYIDRGYVSSGVLLPDQQITDGVVVYRAVEGTLGGVELVGGSKLSERYVEKRIARQVPQPLNVADVQEALRYMQNDPNVARLDARLAPATDLGSSVLRLSIDDQPRFQAGLGTDNHRATSTGSSRTGLLFGWRNLTGFGEEFQLSTGITEGADDSSASFSFPFSAKNATLQAYYSDSDADIVEDQFRVLDIKSQTETTGLALSVPFVDRLQGRFAVSLALESTHSETELLGIPFSLSPGAVDGEAETATAALGLDWLHRGNASVTGFRLNYRKGLDALDATVHVEDDPFNPTGADALFDLWQTQLTYMVRLNGSRPDSRINDRAQFVMRTFAQITQDPLLSLEKIAIGGVNTVRGYPENLLVRDNGVAVNFEIQLPLPGYRPEPHIGNLVLVPFIDYGRSWDSVDTDPISDSRNTDEARSIASAGLGFLWNPVKGLDAQLYFGSDIADNFEGDDPRQFREEGDLQDDGVHFGITYVFRW